MNKYKFDEVIVSIAEEILGDYNNIVEKTTVRLYAIPVEGGEEKEFSSKVFEGRNIEDKVAKFVENVEKYFKDEYNSNVLIMF